LRDGQEIGISVVRNPAMTGALVTVRWSVGRRKEKGGKSFFGTKTKAAKKHQSEKIIKQVR